MHSLEWAGGGHVPATAGAGGRGVQGAEAELRLCLARQDRSVRPRLDDAGVASPVYDAAGNYMIPALNGEIVPEEAAKKIRDELQGQAK